MNEVIGKQSPVIRSAAQFREKSALERMHNLAHANLAAAQRRQRLREAFFVLLGLTALGAGLMAEAAAVLGLWGFGVYFWAVMALGLGAFGVGAWLHLTGRAGK